MVYYQNVKNMRKNHKMLDCTKRHDYCIINRVVRGEKLCHYTNINVWTVGAQDQRVAGVDDHTAMCISCEGLMLRLNEDVFQPYFEEVATPVIRDKASSS